MNDKDYPSKIKYLSTKCTKRRRRRQRIIKNKSVSSNMTIENILDC